jgi:NAD(P)-dependent dehydrogenase (short-subunit alcohol dehydrogenase family)
MRRLEGKVAVVTGGNSGIGLATAKRFHEEGARVAISGRNQESLAQAARSLGAEAVTEQQYDEQFDVNTKGSFFTIQKALPHLNDGASIILNTSVASHKGRPSGYVYAATKAALVR